MIKKLWQKLLDWLTEPVPTDPDHFYTIHYVGLSGVPRPFTFYLGPISRKEVNKPMSTFRFPVEDKDFVKSSDSQPGGIINCVEVARKPEGVAVRSSKDTTKNTVFFTHDEWRAFLGGVNKGEFNV